MSDSEAFLLLVFYTEWKWKRKKWRFCCFSSDL